MSYQIENGYALWLSGLPGAGKTTVARALQTLLDENNVANVLLDGDEVRPIICEHLGHSAEDRRKSLEHYIQLSKLMTQNKVISILAIINHSVEQRAVAKEAHYEGQFGKVWIDTPLEVCRDRDPKGLYKKALAKPSQDNMVGVDIAYENADEADVIIRTLDETPQKAAARIFDFLKRVALTPCT